MRAVIDASALLAHLLDEPGKDRLLEALQDESVMSTVNFAEVAARLVRGGADEALLRELVAELPVEFVQPDEEIAIRAALMFPVARRAGLSPADRICLATGQAMGLPVVTVDRVWAEVAGEIGVELVVVR